MISGRGQEEGAQVAHSRRALHVIRDHESPPAVLSADERIRGVRELRWQAHLLEVGAVAGDVEGERVEARRR